MLIKTLPVGQLETNCYVVTNEDTLACVVIDPGDESNYILNYLEDNHLNCEAIFLTHGHYDHVGAVEAIMEETGAPVYLCARDDVKSSKPDHRSAIEKVNDAAERREQQAKRNAKAVHGILVEGLDNCLIKFSRCCTPVPGDDIIGFITRGQGVSIHRKDCQNYRKRDTSPENEGRWINVDWADTISDVYTTTITISSKDRNGLVMDIATVLNSMNAKVRNLSSRSVGYGQAVTVITLEVKNATELRYIMNRIAGVAGVSSVMRNGN